MHVDRTQLEQQIADLVRQYAGFVHVCAKRQTHGDAHLADDVTQAVFILLTRKIRSLKNPGAIQSWLFKTTRYAAANAVRIEARRRHHEQQAAMLCETSETTMTNPLQLEHQPMLDDAIASLRGHDRGAVLLSFFDNKSSRELGDAMGVSEIAARKRLSRAIGKLRAFFLNRGVVMSERALSATLAGALHGQSLTASAALVQSATASALGALHGTASIGAPLSIAKGVNHMLAIVKLKFAACAVVCAVFAGTATIVATAQVQQKAPATQPAKITTASNDPGIAKFDDGVSVGVAGLCKLTDDAHWWSADGAAIDVPCDVPAPGSVSGSTAIYLRVQGVPDDAGIEWVLPPNTWSAAAVTEHGAPVDHAQLYTFTPNREQADFTCRVASGEWEAVAESEGADNSRVGEDASGCYTITSVGEKEGMALVHASYDIPNNQVRLIAVDSHGVERTGRCIFSGGTKSFATVTIQFEFAPQDLAKVILQKRPYDHVVEIKNVTMNPNRKTKVEVNAKKS